MNRRIRGFPFAECCEPAQSLRRVALGLPIADSYTVIGLKRPNRVPGGAPFGGDRDRDLPNRNSPPVERGSVGGLDPPVQIDKRQFVLGAQENPGPRWGGSGSNLG